MWLEKVKLKSDRYRDTGAVTPQLQESHQAEFEKFRAQYL